ncbi:MAG: efflux RND transporter periplasmic adaptor subunit [Verrucomicrobia bacterium]|nr:efflux RND transporter periplasmic adaptor subunit [Verrucomicrobiota bacterium]
MAKNLTSRIVKWVVVLALLGGAGGGGWWYWQSQQNSTPKYQTTTVSRGDLTQAVTATGQLNPVVNVQVGCQISGMIQKLFADFNSIVKAGQLVAQIDPATYQAAVHQAEGDLANARASLELAQINAKRNQELRSKDLVSQADLDTSLATLHQGEASVKLKEAALEKTKVDLARCTICSPVDGIVISRNVDVGQTVAASLNAPTLFVIANDLTKMQIDSNVAEADIGNVEVGQDVNFTVDAFPFRTFHGKVTQIRNSPIMVQNVVSYDTVIEVANRDMKLRPGMTANVSIIVAQREGALKIPNSAMRFRPAGATADAATKSGSPAASAGGGMRGGAGGPGGGGGGWRGGTGRAKGERSPTRTVYVLPADAKDGDPKPVTVKAGISDGVSTEVLEGLKEGDMVVTGQTVATQGSTPSTSPFGGGMRRF